MKIKKHSILTFCILVMLIFLPTTSYAQLPSVGDLVDGGIAGVLNFFKGGLVLILTIPVKGLLEAVMQYQTFFSAGVNAGWTATRDFTNLFFALILLFIAIATVLNIGSLDNYTAKRVLPSFIFAALFINFSKAIVGFLIDISQIIMVSFYNTFGPDLANVIGNASRLSEGASTVGGAQISASIISLFNIIIVIILIFVFLWTTVILAMRIVTLWFVIILSPLAFISFIIPPLRSLGNSWSQQLQSALVTGPVLMFLLYLAFTIMNTDFNGAPSGENLFSNGNLINYVLVIGLLIIANIEAQKAGNSAPGIVKSAVGVAGTVATFGLGAYIGAGGYGTGKMLKKGVELGDKGIGGLTNVTRQNARYESAKKDLKERQAKGTLGGKRFGAAIQGFSAAGKKEQLEDYEEKYAEKLASEKKLDDPANERYKTIYNTNLAKTVKELDDSGLDIIQLRTQLYDAIQKDNLKLKQATLIQIAKLGELGKVFQSDGTDSNENKFFTNFAKTNATEGEMTEALVSEIETNKSGVSIANSSLARNFRTRLNRVGADKKGQLGFVANIEKLNTNTNPAQIAQRTISKGLTTAIEDINKNPNIFRKRKKDPSNPQLFELDNGKPVFEPDDAQILALIDNEGSESILEEPKTWSKLNQQSKKEFLQVVGAAAIANSSNTKYAAAVRGLQK